MKEEIKQVLLDNSYDSMMAITSEEMADKIQLIIYDIDVKKGLGLFWNELAKWSQATFGTDAERGPMGAILHLQKEAKELETAPKDLMEYVDCLFLIFDGCRRTGFTFLQLLDACWKKLEENKNREWPKLDPSNFDKPVEHIK